MDIESRQGHRPDEIRAVPLRHPGRWVATAVLLVLAAMLAHSMVTNPHWGWGTIRSNLFAPPIVQGAEKTLELTAISMLVGVILGVLFAVMRLSPNPILSGASWTYIWLFRGTPVYVQLLFWYAVSYLFPVISLGIHGQFEAAQSLGMRRVTLMRRIVLPQAMRVIVPPTGNEVNNMLKTTSLAVVVTYPELVYQTNNYIARTYITIPFYINACIWYLFMTTLLTIGQFYVERYYARGSSYALPPTPIQRLRRNLTTLRRIPFSASGLGES